MDFWQSQSLCFSLGSSKPFQKDLMTESLLIFVGTAWRSLCSLSCQRKKMWTIFFKCHPKEPTLKLFLTYKMSWQDYHIISIAAVENIKGSWFKIKQKSTLSCLKSNTRFPFLLFFSHLQIAMQFGKVGLSSHSKHTHVRPASANGSNHFILAQTFCYCSKWDFFCSWLTEADLGPLHLLPASVPTPKIAYWGKKCQLLSSTGCFLNPLLEGTYFKWNLACHHVCGQSAILTDGRWVGSASDSVCISTLSNKVVFPSKNVKACSCALP